VIDFPNLERDFSEKLVPTFSHPSSKDASRPVLIVANLSFAVYDRICFPAGAEIQLTLSTDPKPTKGETAASPLPKSNYHDAY